MPCPVRGDWIQAKGEWSKVVLKFYSAPPRIGGCEIDVPRGNPHQYIGPVHDVDHCAGFVTVLVPHPTTGQLAWTNIWRAKADKDGYYLGYGSDFAHLVSNNVLASWFRRGFENQFQVWPENGLALWVEMLNMDERYQVFQIVRGKDSSFDDATRLPKVERGGASSSGDRWSLRV